MVPGPLLMEVAVSAPQYLSRQWCHGRSWPSRTCGTCYSFVLDSGPGWPLGRHPVREAGVYGP